MCRHCAGNFESFSHLSIASSHFTFEKIKGNNSEETWPKPHCFDGTPVRWKRIWGMHSFVYRSLYGVNWLWCFVLFCFFVCFSPQSSLACLIYGHINICNSGAVWVEICNSGAVWEELKQWTQFWRASKLLLHFCTKFLPLVQGGKGRSLQWSPNIQVLLENYIHSSPGGLPFFSTMIWAQVGLS